MTTTSAGAFDTPVIKMLTQALSADDSAAVIEQRLVLADIKPITAFDDAVNAEMNAERLERGMAQRGIGASMVRPADALANTARQARIRFARQSERAAEAAPPRQAAARPRSTSEAGDGLLTLEGLHAAQFVQLGGGRKDASTLEEEASAECIGAVARNRQAFLSLRELQEAAKAGNDAKMARGYAVQRPRCCQRSPTSFTSSSSSSRTVRTVSTRRACRVSCRWIRRAWWPCGPYMCSVRCRVRWRGCVCGADGRHAHAVGVGRRSRRATGGCGVVRQPGVDFAWCGDVDEQGGFCKVDGGRVYAFAAGQERQA